MEIIQIADQIRKKIGLLEHFREQLEEASLNKAKAISEYDSMVAIETLKLKDEGYPTTILDKLAKGKCADYRYAQDLAETKYKSINTIIDSIKAELNGYQSIFRWLEEVRK